VILVTGGLGMIGAHTARALVDLGHEVVVTAHRRSEVPSFLAGRVTVEALDVTDRDAFLALGGQHEISDIVHLAGSIPGDDSVGFFRTDLTGLLNALDAARPWHEGLELPTAVLPHLIIAFKKAVEPLTTHSLQGSGVQPVVLRIGSIWGPLMDPETPFNPIPPYVSAVLRGEQPQPLHADDGGDLCYAPDAGRAIALLTTAENLRYETYNVSSGRPFTNRELAGATQAITPGRQLEVRPGRQVGLGPDPYLDITRLTQDTGFAPTFDGRRSRCPLRRVARRQPPLKGPPMLDPDVRRDSTAPPSRTWPPCSRTAPPIRPPSTSAPTATGSYSSPGRTCAKPATYAATPGWPCP
jgi:nucleoside-diphosphate-sugar epimerase